MPEHITAAGDERSLALAREIIAIATREGWPAGARLPEPKLAGLCRVSRTPVRRALDLLSRLGVTSRRPEGGHALAVDPASPLVEQALLPREPVDPLYRTVLAERFAGLLGNEITVASVVERYGVARGKAQDLLERLRENGIVRRSVGHSWIFEPGLVDDASYGESMDFRLLVEPAALTAPGFRRDMRVIAGLRRRHEAALAAQPPPSIADLVELDIAFHEALADCSGNRFLQASIRQHTALRRVDEYQIHAMRDHHVETIREHVAVLDALEAADQRLAAHRLTAHLLASHHRQPAIEEARALAYRRLVRR